MKRGVTKPAGLSRYAGVMLGSDAGISHADKEARLAAEAGSAALLAALEHYYRRYPRVRPEVSAHG